MELKTGRTHSDNFSFSSTRWRRRANLKALSGRGRKQAEWVIALYHDRRSDFERLRSAGAKLDTAILRMHTLKLIMDVENCSKYNESVMWQGKPVVQFETASWVQNFM